VRHVADLLGAFGERLRAGDIIIGGSVVPPVLVEPDEPGVAFVLDPVGEVSVRLSR
jgi:2-keto-4-pentenoate hydratase